MPSVVPIHSLKIGTSFCSTWTTPTSRTGGAACAGLLERAKPSTTASAATASTIKGTLIFRFLKIWTKRVFILFSDSPRAGELSAVPTTGVESTRCLHRPRLPVFFCNAGRRSNRFATPLCVQIRCFGGELCDDSWSRDDISPQSVVTTRDLE